MGSRRWGGRGAAAAARPRLEVPLAAPSSPARCRPPERQGQRSAVLGPFSVYFLCFSPPGPPLLLQPSPLSPGPVMSRWERDRRLPASSCPSLHPLRVKPEPPRPSPFLSSSSPSVRSRAGRSVPAQRQPARGHRRACLAKGCRMRGCPGAGGRRGNLRGREGAGCVAVCRSCWASGCRRSWVLAGREGERRRARDGVGTERSRWEIPPALGHSACSAPRSASLPSVLLLGLVPSSSCGGTFCSPGPGGEGPWELESPVPASPD